ncbi:MAG: sensor histidine kinase [Pseudanabaena sp.]|nr:MAG: sensor histidine kinase [Pseudanabaena sp.]
MRLIDSLPQTFRYLEWIILIASLGMRDNVFEYPIAKVLWIYPTFFILGCIYPAKSKLWQQIIYVVGAICLIIWARLAGVDVGILLFTYIAKSYFLLGQSKTILITAFSGMAWVAVQYSAQLSGRVFQYLDPSSLDPLESIKFLGFGFLTFFACSTFTIMFCSMMVAENRSWQKAKALALEVESLAATLERTRIARDIHDSLGHTLTDLDIQLAVAQRLRSHNLEQSFQAIDTAKILSSQCIEDVSQALHQMRQSDFNLNQALTILIEKIHHYSQIQMQWELNLPEFSFSEAYQIYCIVKEGIINIQKHAFASQVSFRAYSTEQKVILELRDNGVGFDLELTPMGFGIQGMIERSQLLGGNLTIKTAPNQGTAIQVTLPL